MKLSLLPTKIFFSSSKNKGSPFSPNEIIFASTTACNLHCKHCFIDRRAHHLEVSDAVNFLQTCPPTIEKIGFSGGEPFLYLDFILSLVSFAVKKDLLFDQIVTNGDWWKDESDLCEKLQALYDAGYDGKIALSWDSFHAQKTERMLTFISAVQELFGQDSINIQMVISDNNSEGEVSPSLQRTAPKRDGSLSLPPLTGGLAPRNAPQELSEIKIYKLLRTYPSEDFRAWNSSRWFSEDYCKGPGNILYVHADGNIAPCCGFANENPELFIGKITDSYQEVMKKAERNKMVKLCFQEGLSHFRRHGLKKILCQQGKKLPGRTKDICTFCDYICKNFKP